MYSVPEILSFNDYFHCFSSWQLIFKIWTELCLSTRSVVGEIDLYYAAMFEFYVSSAHWQKVNANGIDYGLTFFSALIRFVHVMKCYTEVYASNLVGNYLSIQQHNFHFFSSEKNVHLESFTKFD